MRFVVNLEDSEKRVEWEKEAQKNPILTKWYDTIFQSLQASKTR